MSFRAWCHNCRWSQNADTEDEAKTLSHEHSINPRHRDGVHAVEYAEQVDEPTP